MKKIILLLTMLCVSQLYGMEQPKKELSLLEAENIGGLPKELQDRIAQTAIASSNNLDEAITMIKKLSASFGVRYDKLFNNLDDFTQLVHKLANKFKISTIEVSKPFRTPISQKYDVLTFRAKERMNDWNASWVSGSIEDKKDKLYASLNQLIKEGLDVNMTYANNYSLLADITSQTKSPTLVKLLLNAGANPHYKDREGKTALDKARFNSSSPWLSFEERVNYAAIIQLLEEAMQKQSQDPQK